MLDDAYVGCMSYKMGNFRVVLSYINQSLIEINPICRVDDCTLGPTLISKEFESLSLTKKHVAIQSYAIPSLMVYISHDFHLFQI